MPEGEGPSRERLVGRWIHSHEEDSEDRQAITVLDAGPDRLVTRK
jgi:hypothetical protein